MDGTVATRDPLAARQFGLAGLLSLVLACAIYCGVLRSIGDYFRSFERIDVPVDMARPYLPTITVIFGWCALWILYRRWNMRPALWVHYTGPIICSPLVPIVACLHPGIAYR